MALTVRANKKQQKAINFLMKHFEEKTANKALLAAAENYQTLLKEIVFFCPIS